MKAACIDHTGPPEVIQYRQLDDPAPGPGEVLLRMEAASVNPIDCYARSGMIATSHPVPWIPGRDIAGTIVAAGPGVQQFAVGDRVWATNQGFGGRQGTNAELCVVEERWLCSLPRAVAAETAAAAALVGVTAHLGLVQRIGLRSGETLLIRGSGGSVGDMVMQMAIALGARVIALAGNDDKAARARELGAVAAINYRTEDIASSVRTAAPQGVDVAWDTTREPDFRMLVPLLAERGRIVLMAGREAEPPFPVGPFYVKQCSMHGIIMLKMTPEEMRQAALDINRWLEAGAIRPQIAARFPLAQTADAHRLQESATLGNSNDLAGKIVLFP